ncbi:MAG: hypothetical protein LBV08_08145 [Clostridiales bacterium]|nr:hypothetical protein [Clostridiales bacterium]
MKKFFFAAITLILLSACAKSDTEQGTPDITPEISSPAVSETIISIDELKQGSGYLLLDLRESTLFNGFMQEGFDRGGHLKGAINFPYSTLKDLNGQGIDLLEYLKGMGVTPDKKIVIYSNDNGKSFDLSRKLIDLGFEDVKFFEGLADWANDTSLELIKYPNYQAIVNPTWINKLINDEKPESYNNSDYIVLEACTDENASLYEEGHIPGAISFNLNNIESEATAFGLNPYDAIIETLLEYGVTADKTVVVYSRDDSSAARLVFTLLWAGVKDARFLDGGYAAWEQSIYDKDTTINGNVPETNFGGGGAPKEGLIIGAGDIATNLQDPTFKLLSIRGQGEYSASVVEPLISRPGEISGAIWGYDTAGYLNPNGTLKSFGEVKEMWSDIGIEEGDRLCFSSTFSDQACLPWFIAYVGGWGNISLFDGGYYSWQLDSSRPVQTGQPAGQ